MAEQNTVPRAWAEEWRTRYGQVLASLEVAEARVAELEALLWEAYEDDHRGTHGPVGDLGERIYAALKGKKATTNAG